MNVGAAITGALRAQRERDITRLWDDAIRDQRCRISPTSDAFCWLYEVTDAA